MFEKSKVWLKLNVMGQSIDDIYLPESMRRAGYSLKQFQATKSIFVHIPKAAGVSVNKGIYGNLGAGHRTINGYKEVFSDRELDSFFKFTFVRNPVDRAYSAFKFLKSGGFNETDNQWARQNIAEFESFDRFVDNWLNETNIWNGFHFRPQWHYVCDPYPSVKVDFVGRFESFDSDIAFVCDRLNVSQRVVGHENKTKGELTSSKSISSSSIKRLQEVYSRDFELFNY